MAGLGQTHTYTLVILTSGLSPRADIVRQRRHVRLVPKSGRGPLFDHLVGASEQPRGNFNAERLGRLEVNR